MLQHLQDTRSCSTVWCQWLMSNIVLCGCVPLTACHYTPATFTVLLMVMVLVRQQGLLSSATPLLGSITCWYVTQCSRTTSVSGLACLLLTVVLYSGLSWLFLCLLPQWWVVSSYQTCTWYHGIASAVCSAVLMLTKKMWGVWWRWALVSPDGVAPRRMVNVFASVNLPLHHKVQNFSSGTGSPGGPGKSTVKRLWWWCGFSANHSMNLFPALQQFSLSLILVYLPLFWTFYK